MKAKDSKEFRSKLVWKCFKTLSQLGGSNNVILCWVQGHAESRGNENSDMLANKASEAMFIGPELYFGISKKGAMFAINNWAEKEDGTRWENISGLRVNRLTLCAPFTKIASNLIKFQQT